MNWHPVRTLRRCALVMGVTALSLQGVQAPGHAAPAPAAPTTFAFSGHAAGSLVKVGSVVKSGPTAYVTLGCTSLPGVVHSNNTATTNITINGVQLGRTGTTVDTIKTDVTGGVSTTTAESDVQNVSLVNGLVSADALHSTAVTSGAPIANSGGTTFANLRISGLPYGGDPAPNTKLDLGPIGYVILNEQMPKSSGPGGGTMTVNAVHIVLLNQPSIGTPVDIVIGQAQSGLQRTQSGVMSGLAYGTNLKVLNGTIGSGRTAFQPLPCVGTHGQVRENTVASLALPSVLSTGTVTSDVVGDVTAAQATATVTNVIQNVDLAGRVRADVVKTELSGIRPTGGTQSLTDNTSFVGLTIDGTTYGGTPPPNTKIQLAGLGTLWLHRVIVLPSGLTEVRSIELVLSSATGGLPVGTSIKVGVVSLELHD